MDYLKSTVKINKYSVTSTGILGIYDSSESTIFRISVEDASGGNTIQLSGRIKGQSSWQLISSITGNYNNTVVVSAYDEVKIECTSYATSSDFVKFSLSGFSYIVGAEIDDSITDIDSTWSSSKIDNLITSLGDHNVRVTRFATIGSGTTGSVTIPPEQEVILDDFGGTVDAIVSTVSSGRPTLNPAQDVSGAIVATTFDAFGNYTFTSTPSSYPVAIIYRVRQKLSTYDDTDTDIVGYPQYDQVTSVNGKFGTVILDALDVGALSAVNALTVELMWNQLYPSFYTEMTYNINNDVTQIDIWTDNTKTTQIFTKVFTYSGNQVQQVQVTHLIDGAILTKNFTYNINGFITNVDRVYTP